MIARKGPFWVQNSIICCSLLVRTNALNSFTMKPTEPPAEKPDGLFKMSLEQFNAVVKSKQRL